MNHNLFAALREGFPADLDAVAIECADGTPLAYAWRDLERGTATMANLLASLDLRPHQVSRTGAAQIPGGARRHTLIRV